MKKKCQICEKKVYVLYEIDYHITKNSHSWECNSDLKANDELSVCKECAIKYKNSMEELFGRTGFKKWMEYSTIKEELKR